MPSKETFHSPAFRCRLHCQRCRERKADGTRCNNRVCHGVPTCWIHTKKKYNVQRKDSPTHGKGLFATNDIPANEYICPYGGQLISTACLNRRYPGDVTAPYTTDTRNNRRVLDGACRRGTGCVANGLFLNNGTSRARRYHNAEIRYRGNDIWLRSIKEIPAGREIFVYYGDGYTLNNNHSTKRSSKPDTRPC